MSTPLPPRTLAAAAQRDGARRHRLGLALGLATLALLALGLAVGSAGWSWAALQTDLRSDQAALILGQIRAPRTLGAWAVGALLGLAGAIAQGVFRNPLADPYLVGSAAGASLAVVAVLVVLEAGPTLALWLGLGSGSDLGSDASGAAAGAGAGPAALLTALGGVGLVAAAFAGALGGVLLTLALARGAQHTVRLLLAGVVVGVVLGAAGDLLTTLVPQALRGRQAFLLGSTAALGWDSVAWLSAGLVLALPAALRLARVLDALTLGEDTAASLGLPLARWRMALVLLLALCTGLAVSQAGLVAFVGLIAPHLVRRFAPAPHAYTLAASAAAGGALLMGADVLSRGLAAPQELPVGVVTALVGGGYLLWLLHRRGVRA